MEVAVQANDEVLKKELTRYTKFIPKINYRTLKKHEVEGIMYLADTGVRACDNMLFQTNDESSIVKLQSAKNTYNSIYDMCLQEFRQ